MKRKMKLESMIVFLLILLNSCQTRKEVNVSVKLSPLTQNKDIFIADLDSVECKKKIALSSIFKKVHYIPLETNEHSLIGRINQLWLQGDTIFILDLSVSKTVQIFAADGKYLGMVGGKGTGPGEYLKPTDFGVDGSCVYVFDSAGQKINFYRLPGMEFDHSYSVKSQESVISRYLAIESDRIYTDIYMQGKNNPYLVREINKKNEDTNQWLSTDQYNRGYLSSTYFVGESFFHKTINGVRYSQMMMDTIMQIHDGKMSPYLAICYADRPTSQNVEQAVSDDSQDIPTVMAGLGGVFNIRYYTEWNNYILFSFQKGRYGQVGLLDKDTREFQWADQLSYDLTFPSDLPTTVNPIPVFGTDKGLYSYIHPMEMERFVELVSRNETFLSSSDFQLLKSLSADSNPVLLYYEME